MLRIIKNKLKEYKFLLKIKNYLYSDKVSRIMSIDMPENNCIDVGASYFEHSKWRVFLNSKNTKWIAVDPNIHNLEYTKKWRWECKVNTVSSGLSEDGGSKTLYVTNIDSGSSLKKVNIHESNTERIKGNMDYFFPVTEKKIETISLKKVIEDNANTGPIFIKLDTQGTELDIIRGAEEYLKNNRIAGVELETALLAKTQYEGGNKLWEVIKFFEEKNFEMINIQIYDLYSSEDNTKKKNFLPNECDVVFVPRLDIIKNLSIDYKISIASFYYSYKLFNQIYFMINENEDLENWFKSKGISKKLFLDL
jgi:FkbM family methyltransferase